MNEERAKQKISGGYLKENKKVEEYLLNKLPDERLKANFLSRLRPLNDGYWQIMSEMRAIHIFHNILKVPVLNIEEKTVNEKSVDFTLGWQDKKIYVEVKGFRPSEVVRGESLNDGSLIISRALGRAIKKFLNDTCNLVIIADENTKKCPLIDNARIFEENGAQAYLSNADYQKVSALMVLGGWFTQDLNKYMIWYNDEAQKTLPSDIRGALERHKIPLFK